MLRLLAISGLLLTPAFAQTEFTCPVNVTGFEIHGENRSSYALITLKNRGLQAVKGVEYQWDAYDSELRIFLARYYLTAGKIPGVETGLGKPVEPGKTKALSGYISRGLAIVHNYWMSDGDDIKINVLYFTDGTKWERKGWQDEPRPYR